jgi:vacuolar-type H+-ATPase catalytic subunit A/Vma1
MSGDAGNREAVLGEVKELDEEFCELLNQEASLNEIWRRLQHEAVVLQQALKEASETGEQQMQQRRLDKDATAISRLEQALMMESSSDEDERHFQDVQSLVSFSKSSQGRN